MTNGVVFRADASTRIGSGHIARCLTFAVALRERGMRCVFVCRAGPGEPSGFIASRGFEVRTLDETPAAARVEALLTDREQAADAAQTLAAVEPGGASGWFVVDHYGLGTVWEEAAAARGAKVMVIDDLANRRHTCDLLLDQNYYARQGRYDALVPPHCKLYLGPRHVLLRPEFSEAKACMRPRDGTVKRILIAFGGSDESGETMKALHGVRASGLAIDVVSGASNPHREALRALCADIPGCVYHEQVDYMARLIAQADLALGAGGAMTWERCALGVPALTVVTAPNQRQTTVDTAALGAAIFLGEATALDSAAIGAAVAAAVADPARNRAISERAFELVPAADGAAYMAHAMTSFDSAEAPLQNQPYPAGHA
jgi:UDP-2,4-diacetamido-2,4,6-trideoxy-beta-L-altropyranose hydrolase